MDKPSSGAGRSAPDRRPAGRGGFTLLEVVVATAVLIVLTLMIGSLFRQATSAWNTGRVRGEGSMLARAVLGSVSRDLATAVDGRPYGFSGGPEADGGSLSFVCLRAARTGKDAAGDVLGESVHKITYSVTKTVATRKDETWTGSRFDDAQTFTIYEIDAVDSPIESATFELVGPAAQRRSFEDPGAASRWQGATGVKLRMKISQKGAFTGVSVRSLGKNGKGDEDASDVKDDIVVN